MKLGTQVGLGPGHIVIDEDPAPLPTKGHSPQFLAHICCGQIAGWIKMPLGMKVDLSPGDFVLSGDRAPSPKSGRSPSPILRVEVEILEVGPEVPGRGTSRCS